MPNAIPKRIEDMTISDLDELDSYHALELANLLRGLQGEIALTAGNLLRLGKARNCESVTVKRANRLIEEWEEYRKESNRVGARELADELRRPENAVF